MVLTGTVHAGQNPGRYPDTESLLPPLMDWSGASESLIAQPDDPWVTPAEKTGLVSTPSYDETVGWLERHLRKNRNQPFFAFVAFHEPHEPIASDKRFSDL